MPWVGVNEIVAVVVAAAMADPSVMTRSIGVKMAGNVTSAICSQAPLNK